MRLTRGGVIWFLILLFTVKAFAEDVVIKELKFDNVPLEAVLKSLSLASGKSIIIDPNIMGRDVFRKRWIIGKKKIAKKESKKEKAEETTKERKAVSEEETITEVVEEKIKVANLLDTPVNVFIQEPVGLDKALNIILREYNLIAVPVEGNIYRITLAGEAELNVSGLAEKDIERIIQILKARVTPSAEIVWDKAIGIISVRDEYRAVERIVSVLEDFIKRLDLRITELRLNIKGLDREATEEVINAIKQNLSDVGTYAVDVTTGELIVKDRGSVIRKYGSSWENFIAEKKREIEEGKKKRNPITRVFFLKNIDVYRARELISPYITETTFLTESPSFNALVITDYPENIAKFEEVLKEFLKDTPTARKPVTKIFYLKYISPEEFLELIRPLLSEAGKVLRGAAEIRRVIEERPSGGLTTRVKEVTIREEKEVLPILREFNAIMITDYPEVIDKIKELYRDYISEIPPQVKIEARILEVRKEVLRELGINWSALLSRAKVLENWSAGAGVNVGVGSPGSPVPGLSDTSGGILTFTYSKGYLNALNLRLSAFERIGKIKALAKPTVVTISGKTAVIKQGQEIPYQTTIVAGGGAAANILFKEAVLKLEVTPIISPDGRILMDIVITQDTPGVETPVGPAINTKQVSTKVIVKDGDTVVIGGIIDTLDRKTTEGVAGLVRIPILKWLFGQETKELQDIELLIFITPTILTE